MKKINFLALVCLGLLSVAVSLALAGVTEIKLYSNENPPRYNGGLPVGNNAAATSLGLSGDNPHVNGLVIRLGMNGDIIPTAVPPDSSQMWATAEAAAMGPYGLKVHFAGSPNPRFWFDIQRSDTPGYTDPLDASATERVTFWIKAPKGNEYPLWLRIRGADNAEGQQQHGAYICIQGETVVRNDAFGFPYAASKVPWNGEWQFVSLPWTFIKTSIAADLQAVVPYSWGGITSRPRYYGEWLDLATIQWLSLDTKDGGEETQGNFPFPGGINNTVGSVTYMVDEIVFTLNEGSGVSDVSGNPNVMPLTYDLGGNYPNPFNPTTSFSYSLPVSNNVTIDIYNELGTKVRSLVNRFATAGTYTATWDGQDDSGMNLPSGIYFYKMQASHFSSVKKMLLTK